MESTEFLLKFSNGLNKLINPSSDKILVAVSGGVDSIVLVHLLKKLSINFEIAHCNFKLRAEESDDDEKFVRDLAQELKIFHHALSFETQKIHKNSKLSLQETARKLRYDWFMQLRNQYSFDYVATAHHLNDSIETIFLNLTHGCGIRGLHGIPELNPVGNIIRPLLTFSKNEILDYASQEAIKFREDSSNQSLKYERNKIRQQVIPVLEVLNPGLYNTFRENIFIFKEIEILYKFAIKTLTDQILEKAENCIFQISIKKLKAGQTGHSLLFEALNPYGFNQKQIFQILEHLDKQSGAVYFSENYKLIKSYDFLILEKKAAPSVQQHKLLADSESEINGFSTDFENYNINFKTYTLINTPELQRHEIALFDADKIIYPLSIRNPRKGDFFYPFGMSGKMKLLSKFFKDEKISLPQRNSVMLICSGENIIWIVGMRTDERFKVDNNTKKVLEIKYNKQS